MSEVHEALGAAYAGSGQLARAHEAFTRARRLSAGDALRESHLMQLHARTAMDAGEVQRAARWLLRATRAVAGLDGPAAVAARAEIDCELAGVRARQGRMDEAIALCETVIGHDGVPDASLAHACYVLDWVLVESGRAAEAVHSQRALEIYRRLGDLDREAAVLNNLGMFAYYEGRWADAVRLYRAGAEVSMKAGNIGSAAFGDCNLGELRADQGRTDEARRHLQRALEVWRATGYAWGVAFATALLGRLEARAGHGTLAEAHLHDALARFRQLRISPDALWVEALIPEACVFDGRPHDALGELDRLIDVAATGRLAPLLFRARAVACAQLGRLDEASAALDASVAAARARCDEFELFLSLDVLCALAAAGGAADAARERDAIAARLDIAAPPPVPLAPPVGAC
jgi:tetratricopeptide (TPR) repeat protein